MLVARRTGDMSGTQWLNEAAIDVDFRSHDIEHMAGDDRGLAGYSWRESGWPSLNGTEWAQC